MWSIHEGNGGFRVNAVKGTIFQSMTTFDLNYPAVDPSGRDFRFYLPVGTKKIKVTYNSESDALVGVVSMAERIPDFEKKDFFSYPWERDRGASLVRLLAGEFYSRNAGGHGTIAYDLNTAVSQGIWVYNRLISGGKGRISNVKVSVTVNKAVFFAWYNSVKNDNQFWDNRGNPLGMAPPPAPDDRPAPPDDPFPDPSPDGNLKDAIDSVISQLQDIKKRMG